MKFVTDEELEAFCRRLYPSLVGFLGLYCGRSAIAEELAQETLARVWRKWPQVHHLDQPEAWAQRVAINLANSYFRRLAAERRARRRMTTAAEAEPAPVEALALRQDISQLPRRQREAVVLHYYLDLDLRAVAERMGSTVPAVKALLHRAIRRLRAENRVSDFSEVPDAN